MGYKDEYQDMIPTSEELGLGQGACGCTNTVVSAALEICVPYSGCSKGGVDRKWGILEGASSLSSKAQNLTVPQVVV